MPNAQYNVQSLPLPHQTDIPNFAGTHIDIHTHTQSCTHTHTHIISVSITHISTHTYYAHTHSHTQTHILHGIMFKDIGLIGVTLHNVLDFLHTATGSMQQALLTNRKWLWSW